MTIWGKLGHGGPAAITQAPQASVIFYPLLV
jgi:hypothetical protein